jgi:hypothetical protein
VNEFWYSVRSWVRWHLPVTREAALRIAERDAERETGVFYEVLWQKCKTLEANLNFLVKALEDIPELARLKELTTPPEPEPPTQRDFDDAVAELIRRARNEFGAGQ